MQSFSGDQSPDKDVEMDLKIYETGPLTNKVLRTILERLSCQYTELVMTASEALLSENPNQNAEDQHEIVQAYLKALYLPLPRHSLRLAAMVGLADCLQTRHEEVGDPKDLKESITYRKGALLLCNEDSPERATIMNELAIGLKKWFDEQGGIEHLEMAASYYRQAFRSSFPGVTILKRSDILDNLSRCLLRLHREKDLVEDLEEAIHSLRTAVSLLPAQDSQRPFLLHNLALCLSTLYFREEKIEHLNESIQCIGEATSLYHPEELRRVDATNNLSGFLVTRYCQKREIQDLEKAIQYRRGIINIHPVGHPDRADILLGLSMSLCAWHRECGGYEELEEAIQNLKEVLFSFSSPSPDRLLALKSLGECLIARFDLEAKVQDLEDAIRSYREALLLHPSGSPTYASGLLNLSYSLLKKYKLQTSKTCDLDEAIQSVTEALSLCPLGHADRPDFLSHLANCLNERYKHCGDLQCLRDATQYSREALSLSPTGDPDSLHILLDLSRCLESLYYHNGIIENLKEAVEGIHKYINGTDSMHPNQCLALGLLASMYAKNTEVLKPFYNVTDVSSLFEKASNHPTASIRNRVAACKNWIDAVHGSSSLSAYQRFLDLADQYVLLTSSITSIHQLLRDVITHATALDAVAVAIECGEVKRAVELLEQGRTLLWSHLNRYQTPIHELHKVRPELAAEFTRLSQLLQNFATSKVLNDSPKLSAKEETSKYRKISENWQAVVEQIRQVDGFDTFLRPPQYSYLRLAARNGPVIIINVSAKRCDAIIVQLEGDPVSVSLPDTRVTDICDIADIFNRETRAANSNGLHILGVLRALWDDIVAPVVSKLQELNVTSGSRIWWCPTFFLSLLPIHAAGPHRGKKPNLCDIYISSYTPTLSALAELDQAGILVASGERQLDRDPRLLVVAQPNTPGQVHIPCIKEELSVIEKQVPDASILLSEKGTCGAVLRYLKTHDWVHFMCHGSKDLEEPFESCFRLHDNPLTLLDILRARRTDAQFAFLSACHSAGIDITAPDETIHLAAALHFTGFRSVIGTMYAMADIDGPIVAEVVYKHLFRRKEMGGAVDYRDSAEALQIAIKVLIEKGVPVERWINFVHFGA
ncbi:hypothetical protein FRC02_002325 [Tulasnella sp. 418]|nr:hypothetical protein FRC02_002325 [Tulasnella sp. 418]